MMCVCFVLLFFCMSTRFIVEKNSLIFSFNNRSCDKKVNLFGTFKKSKLKIHSTF